MYCNEYCNEYQNNYCNEYCNEYQNNYCKGKILVLIVILLIVYKNKDYFSKCYEKDLEIEELELEKQCRPEIKCKQPKIRACKPEYIGKCIEDMIWDESEKDYDCIDYDCGDHKKNDKKNIQDLMENFSIDDLNLDDDNMKQASEIIKHLFK